ncbi:MULTISPECIES: tyrosine-type recombinase/integrase [Flavobacteriaceae]|uniref:tyrosine-type recombinase/integrase n=1 Tax=Flavobacteriaceae TaxID=49546 RepID=UPI0014911938|nr:MULTISPECIES: tyrosine-type recombinase/integrase [Allomuricauda]MDC6367607.1 tyrosine-type recombinase/integrase [Muricauda sp. AC10]
MADKDTFVKFSEFLKLKRYSPSTINTYTSLIHRFQRFVGETPLEKLDHHVIVSKVLDFIKKQRYGTSAHKQLLGALRVFYNEFNSIKIDFTTIYPTRKQKFLPEILSKEEVERMLRVTTNLKHKTILLCIYGLGLRRSELIQLKLSDIDGQRMMVHIKNAKGQKDRVVPLSPKLLAHLRNYYRAYKPNHYLFYGAKKQKYSETSLRSIFRKACREANIKKHVTPHSLRHAYATHLMDSGVSIRIIQELLGHNSLKTTMKYTRVTTKSMRNIKTPVDFLNIAI